MPLRIILKDPPIHLIVVGEIRDEDEKKYDEIFSNGCLMVKSRSGQNVIVPLWKESNITLIQEVTEKQLEEEKKAIEEANKGNRIMPPEYMFSGRRSPGRSGGGFQL